MYLKRALTLNVMALIFALGFLNDRAEAATIAANDWWLQTDSLGGLRQSTVNDQMFYAVSQSNVWNPGDTYVAPTGYRLATTAEGLAAVGGSGLPEFTYYYQGGWSGYLWEGLARYYFRFSDSNVTLKAKHAGNHDSAPLFTTGDVNNFAGMVLIAEAATVPVPAALPLLMLALGGLGFAARRRKAA
ncbi:VPLPA-CTERM sorting domain-containing protein [Puniceibacterium sediminis]|uniref:VPLPA-CTERM protein sorting domain-containing protein n=1 Tax=Puniceibacterium sediminis TaxID=1608407 RepID=A0A238V212_9RHOB|nr:VPLPA-CTERM sorting domain-containing protein [Puniceibacterium sediminis]SNR28480.1 VPLPA-CTERM protein sorting domain-containing protein [Puniceibacterium sediminis]